MSPIIGGERIDDEEWAAVVRVEDRCTGTLVHPEVVVYAGHCGRDIDSVTVGTRVIGTEECFVHPEAGSLTGHDLAACVLEDAADGAPIPIATGAVADAVEEGSPVLLVGYGSTGAEESAGRKHTVWTEVRARGVEWLIGREDAGTCAGDSGGPALVRDDDGEWWVLGALSGGYGACGAGYYTDLDVHVGWLSETTHRELGSNLDPGGRGCRLDAERPSCSWMWLVFLLAPVFRRSGRPVSG